MHKIFKPSKPFATYEEQIKNLIDRKGMIISDHDFAVLKLKDISYYALIDGYKTLFYNPMIRKYKEGTIFENIVSLYEFDEELRALIFKYICHIEQKMKSLISYCFCETYSEKQEDYLTPSHYNDSKFNKREIRNLISILEREANINTDHEYVVYQRNTYGNVPMWIIMKTLTFGQMSKMYSLFNTNIQAKVSIHFEHASEKELIQYMKVLTLYRNVCAHNERLFSYKSRFSIPNTKIHEKIGLPKRGDQYICGKNDLFSIVITFRILLNKEEFKKFKKSLNNIIDRYTKEIGNVISKDIFLSSMGFPENWTEVTKYRLLNYK